MEIKLSMKSQRFYELYIRIFKKLRLLSQLPKALGSKFDTKNYLLTIKGEGNGKRNSEVKKIYQKDKINKKYRNFIR